MATEGTTAKATTHATPLDPEYDHYNFPTVSSTVQTGHAGHTTEDQDAKVKELRERLAKKGYKHRLDTLSMVCNRSLYN